MIKCPYCNSKNTKKYDWDINIEENEIILNRQYFCRECKECFSTDQVYSTMSEEKIHEEEGE